MQNQSDRNQLVLKVLDLLTNLGINSEVVDNCAMYFSGELENTSFLDKFDKMDFNSLSNKLKDEISEVFRYIKSKNDEEMAEQYTEIMLNIGDISFFDVITNFYGGNSVYVHGVNGFNRRSVDILDKMNFTKTYLIRWCSQKVSNPNLRSKLFVIDYYNKIYTYNPALMEDSLGSLEGNAQITVGAYLVHKDRKKYKELSEWIDTIIVNSMEALFGDSIIKEDVIPLAVKYINGGLFVKDTLVDEIDKKIRKSKMDNDILQSLMGISIMCFDASSNARRFMKMIFLLDYNKAFDALYVFNDNPNLVFKEYSELLSDLGLPYELYIAWMGNTSAQRGGLFDSSLKREMDRARALFEKAVRHAGKAGGEYLRKFLTGEIFKKKEINFDSIREECIEELERMFVAIKIPHVFYSDYISFFKGEKSFDEIKEKVVTEVKKYTFYSYNYRNLFERISKLKGKSPLFERSIQFFTYAGLYYVAVYDIGKFIFYKASRETFKDLIDILVTSGVKEDGMIPLLAEYASEPYNNIRNFAGEFLMEYAVNYSEEVIRYIPSSSLQQRTYLIELLYKIDREKYLPVVAGFMNDSAKGVRDKVVELLSGYKEAFQYVRPLLNDKKLAVREAAVRILIAWGDEQSAKTLEEALTLEKSDKIKNMICNSMKISAESELDKLEEDEVLEYCRASLKKIKDNLVSWIGFETLPGVRLDKSEKRAPDEIVRYAVASYAAGNFTGLCSETEKTIKFLNKNDFADIALEVLNRWIENGAEAKKKWVLPFSSIYGDDRVTLLLKKKIEDWALNSRGAIASEAVRALALSGRDMALMIVDNISRKFKHRQVREAAAGAFEIAAKELNLDPEDLADRIVPSLDFDNRGERVFDYGGRKFTARLSTNLELEIFDDNDKKLKSLPSPSKNDDQDKVQAEKEDFKALKKGLKAVVDLQGSRLEMALSLNRKWSVEGWNKLFVQNPIMHQFAIGLIWGAYIDENLEMSFRYMEDGTFNTIEEEEYSIPQNASVGLIHPVELSVEEIEKWSGQLEDYEIKQPFEQLTRKVYKVEEAEKSIKNIERFGGIKLNGKSLYGKLTKFGWYRGSVQDAGWYGDFFKESRKLGVGAELHFSGAGVGYEQEEEVTVHEIVFYKAGTIERGSYVYDTVDDKRMVMPCDVPPKFFSEILYDIDRATASSTGFDEKWKNRR